jgi:hypothetical protein
MDITVHSTVADAETLAELNEIVGVVFNLQPIVFAIDIVGKNHSELVNTFDEYLSKLNGLTTANISTSFVIDALISISQKVTNLLSSTSAFLAHTDKQIQKVHGKGSAEWKIWDEKRKDLHAGSFAYRFLYELRNFAQHRDLPFSSLNFTGERITEDAPMDFKMGALIRRDGLLNDGYDWKKLRAEIQQQPAVFDLLPLISEYLCYLRQLCLEAVKPQFERLVLCHHYFDAVTRTLQIPAGAIPVIFVGESVAGVPPSRFEIIPMEQFGYLLFKINQTREASEIKQS